MMERNLTTGSVFKNVIIFSLPYLLSYFLQTLYGMADLFIIGQFEGVASTTAVSIGSQVMHMITVMLVGLAMGTTVSIGQAIGSKDKKRVAEGIGNTVILFMGVALVLMTVLLLLTKPIVTVMSTPQEAVMGTMSYLTICFIGIWHIRNQIIQQRFLGLICKFPISIAPFTIVLVIASVWFSANQTIFIQWHSATLTNKLPWRTQKRID